MITLSQYSGKLVGVFGLGKAGEATVAALLAGGAGVYAWDDSEQSRNRLAQQFPKAKLLPVVQWPWERMPCMVMGPGVPLKHPAARLAAAKNCPVVGEVELLFQAQPQATYIGITGTNGKSTTTALTAHILKECGRSVQVGGNLGTPALALEPLGEDGVYVLELSSYQLDLVRSVRFRVAVLLNITPDHLDRHGDMDGYVAAKMHIFDRQQEGDAAVVAVDDEYTRGIAEKLSHGSARLVQVSAQREVPGGVYAKGGMLDDRLDEGQEWQTDISAITPLTGRHNWQNAAAACAAARLVGVKFGNVAPAMRTFPGLPHRLELVDTVGGVRFINDSKATNADATANALAPYAHIYWILGGKPKEGGIESLVPFFPKIEHAFLIGQAEEEFSRVLKGKVKFTRCGTLEQAVQKAMQRAFAEKKPDAVVLLSPACASFDQFKNFEERGDAFREFVARYKPASGPKDQLGNVHLVTRRSKPHAA